MQKPYIAIGKDKHNQYQVLKRGRDNSVICSNDIRMVHRMIGGLGGLRPAREPRIVQIDIEKGTVTYVE